MKPWILSALLLFAMLPAVEADDWPMFRFDETHQALATGNTQLTLFKSSWWNNVSIPATVKASPVVKDGRVFIGAWDNNVYAFDSESGGLLWKNATGGKITGTAAVSESTVYVATEAGILYAFNAKTGTLERQVSVGATFGSPVVHERRVFIGTTSGAVSAYEGDTLQLVWTFPAAAKYFNYTIAQGGSVEVAPAVYNGQVLFGSTNQWFYSVSEQGTGDQKTTLTWMFKAGGAIRSSPTIDKAGARVLFGAQDGKLYAVPLGSSGNVTSSAWSYQELAGSNLPSQIQSSPGIAYGRVYFGANNGNITALTLAGAKVWSRATGGQVVSSPAIANNLVLVGSSDRKIYLLDAATGELKWSSTATASIEASPAVAGTQGFWADTQGNMYSYGGTKPDRADLKITSVSGSLVVSTAGTIIVNVLNVGVLPSVASTVQVFAGNTLIGTYPVQALQPQDGASVEANYTPTAEGTLTLRAVVDPTNEIREVDESNNVLTFSATVAASAAPSTDASGTEGGAPGFEVWAVLAAVLAGLALWPRRGR